MNGHAAPIGPVRLAGRVPFWVAIVTAVVGLLVATGSFPIVYDLRWGQRSIEVLTR